jgi:hypothetical protein
MVKLSVSLWFLVCHTLGWICLHFLLLFCLVVVWGFELRPLHLLGRHSRT